MFCLKVLIFFLFLNINNAINSPATNLEYFRKAKDDHWYQADIYAEHTIVESRLIGSHLFGFFMNSVVGSQTIESKIADKIFKVYTIFRWNNTLHIITSSKHKTKILWGSRVKEWKVTGLELIKYDYVQQRLYSYCNGTISIYDFGSLLLIRRFYIGSITDYYVINGKIHSTNNCFNQSFEGCHDGKFVEFYISNSTEPQRLKIITIMSMIAVILLIIL